MREREREREKERIILKFLTTRKFYIKGDG